MILKGFDGDTIDLSGTLDYVPGFVQRLPDGTWGPPPVREPPHLRADDMLPVICQDCDGDGFLESLEPCACDDGRHDVTDCPTCGGAGRFSVPRDAWEDHYVPRLAAWRQAGAYLR